MQKQNVLDNALLFVQVNIDVLMQQMHYELLLLTGIEVLKRVSRMGFEVLKTIKVTYLSL